MNATPMDEREAADVLAGAITLYVPAGNVREVALTAVALLRRDAPREGGEAEKVPGLVSAYCAINGCCAMDDAALQRLAAHRPQPAGETRVFNCRRCPVSVESRWIEPECPECGDPCEYDASAKPSPDAPERDAVGGLLSWVTPAVEAAAAALYATDRACGEPRWDALDWGRRMHYQQRAKVAVDAALSRTQPKENDRG